MSQSLDSLHREKRTNQTTFPSIQLLCSKHGHARLRGLICSVSPRCSSLCCFPGFLFYPSCSSLLPVLFASTSIVFGAAGRAKSSTSQDSRQRADIQRGYHAGLSHLKHGRWWTGTCCVPSAKRVSAAHERCEVRRYAVSCSDYSGAVLVRSFCSHSRKSCTWDLAKSGFATFQLSGTRSLSKKCGNSILRDSLIAISIFSIKKFGRRSFIRTGPYKRVFVY